jgi:6,7-dimethyl-8-ribityllumazine synthase
MSAVKIVEGNLSVQGGKFCIIASRFNSFIVEQLEGGAIDALVRHGANPADICLVKAPGAFELPMVVQRVAATKKYDAIIALGAVIRGGTPHFEWRQRGAQVGVPGTGCPHQHPTAGRKKPARGAIHRGSQPAGDWLMRTT